MIEIGVRKIKIFISVVENESFSLAAKKLFVSQPAITIAINQIEELFDYPLFLKSNNKVRKAKLTNKGENIYNIFKEFMSEYDNMIDLVKVNMSSKNEKISVYIDGNGLSNIDSEFFQILKSQKIDDKIDIVSEKKTNILEQLSSDRNSLGIVLGQCNSDNVDFIPINSLPVGVVSNRELDSEDIWDALDGETFFIANVDTQLHTSLWNVLKTKDIDLSKAVTVDDATVFSELVSSGHFVGIAPDLNFSAKSSDLSFIALDGPSLTIDFGVAVNRGRLNCSSVKNFVANLRDIPIAHTDFNRPETEQRAFA